MSPIRESCKILVDFLEPVRRCIPYIFFEVETIQFSYIVNQQIYIFVIFVGERSTRTLVPVLRIMHEDVHIHTIMNKIKFLLMIYDFNSSNIGRNYLNSIINMYILAKPVIKIRQTSKHMVLLLAFT